MANERLAPDSILASSNLSGSVADIDDDPDSPDASWLTTTEGGASDLRISFPTPSSDPAVGADLQENRWQGRKNAAGGNDPTYSAELWENSALVSTLASGLTVSIATGIVGSATWNASLLAAANGSNVELRLVQTGGHTGKPNNRRYLEIGAVEWNAEVQEPGITGDLAATDPADAGAASGNVPVAGDLATSDPADSAAASGGVLVSGDVADAEPADIAALAGGVPLAGDRVASENPDSFAAEGTAADEIQGDLAATDPADSAAASGAVPVAGDLAATDAADSAAASAAVLVSGGATAAEPADTAAVSGGALIAGDLAGSDAPDGPAVAATVLVAGGLASTEVADLFVGAGGILVSGAIVGAESPDSVALAGAVAVSGGLIGFEAGDFFAASGLGTVIASQVAAAQARDREHPAAWYERRYQAPKRPRVHAVKDEP